MWDWLGRLLGEGFMPHGHCYLWTPSMVWAQVTSNLLIGIAYVSITGTLAILVRRIRNIPFAWVYVAFGVFILSCGLTHWFDVITVWHPIYWADAAVRIMTAIASVATAIVIVPMVPRAVALAATARLSDERRQKLEVTLHELEQAHRELSRREHDAKTRATLSEQQFESLVESMPQLAWISAPDGSNLYRNSRWAEYTGLELEALESQGWQSVQDPALVQGVTRKWRASLASGEVFDTECRLRRADGEYRWFIARAAPLREKSGRIGRWIGTCTDIHEQHMLREEALRTAQMKDEFLATISHELRTPLNAILGWSRLLRASPLPATTLTKGLETVERNAVAQVQLIDDLLDISRIVSGKMRLQVSALNPATAVEAAVDSVRPMALAKGLQLALALDHDAGPAMADLQRLQQIVWNLLTNAIKFTPRGGQITVSVMRRDSQVELAVADTGTGITAEFLPRAFDRFSQEDASIRRQQGGLGLGLATVKQLVELHGGSIRVASDGPDKGTRFSVLLPLAEGTPDGAVDEGGVPQMTWPKPPELVDLRVLVVEDEQDSRELIATVLHECGAVVTQAATAERALALLANNSFDVILSDIGLPTVDGYGFMKTVRSNPAWLKVPSAALTGHARAQDRMRALEVGYHMHVPKPVEPLELIAIVADLARIAIALRS